MHSTIFFQALALLQVVVRGQQAGAVSPETHPQLIIQQCTITGGCKNQTAKLVLDANWRWLHGVGSYTNCFDGSWSSQYCPDPVSCAKNCALEGADYSGTYGVTTSGNALTLRMYPSGSTGSRLYLMSDDAHYRTFNLKNQEFTFDVDASALPCGTNGAMYFTSMAADGGRSVYPNNNAGAAYGTGYCDAQCPQDIKFINGEANLLNYTNGKGRYGSCCSEMDLWEANSVSTAYTGHPCTVNGPKRCDTIGSTDCTASGLCDQAGCDFNPYRMGNQTFYGSGSTVKTNSPNKIRVITQFITSDNTATGNLTEIRRKYMQGGVLIANSASKITGVSENSIKDTYCAAEKSAFSEANTFSSKGGMKGIDTAMTLGMVLVLSVWVDDFSHMLWLDSVYGGTATSPGGKRGSCATSTGNPPDVKANYPNTQVSFSNIKFGDIGQTYGPPYV